MTVHRIILRVRSRRRMPLDCLVFGAVFFRIRVVMAAEDAEVRDILQAELVGRGALRELESKEVCAVNVVEIVGGSGISGFSGDFDVAEFYVLRMADVHAGSRKIPEHGGL